jgi:hypothetical protein
MFDPDDDDAREDLFLDIDSRLFGVWLDALTIPRWSNYTTTVFFRLCYAQGYLDALREGVRGQLLIDHGFIVPERSR